MTVFKTTVHLVHPYVPIVNNKSINYNLTELVHTCESRLKSPRRRFSSAISSLKTSDDITVCSEKWIAGKLLSSRRGTLIELT